MRNFNEVFRKNVVYDNIKSHKKTGFHPLTRKDLFRNPPAFLGLKNVGESSTAKNYCPVSLLSVVNKVYEKLVNNWLVDDLDKFGLFF